MPRTVALDDDVFEALQSLAVPLVDDINSVLRRMLQINGLGAEAREQSEAAAPSERPARPSVSSTSKGGKRRRARRGTLLPESEYEVPILVVLAARGGVAPAREAIEALGEHLADRLTELDREVLQSGSVRWKNRAQFVRLKLIRAGDLKKDSPRGTWELSEQGQRRASQAS